MLFRSLIDQEMSKEGGSKHNPPNVVAKLMGLDAFPHVQPDSAAQRNHARGYSRRSLSHSGIPLGSWQQEEALKPSPGKSQDIKAVVSSPSLSPKILHGESFYEEAEDTEILESREMAKEITRQMRENLMGNLRDETLLSSLFSNGYTGDESSFNKSENEYAAGILVILKSCHRLLGIHGITSIGLVALILLHPSAVHHVL